MLTNLHPNLMIVLATAFGALAAGTAYRLVTLRGQATRLAKKRLGSVATWWAVAILITLAGIGGPTAASVLMAAVSILAFTELRSLTPRPGGRAARYAGYFAIGLTYAGIVAGAGAVWLLSVSLVVGFAAAATIAARQDLKHFTESVSSFVFAMLICTTLPAVAVLTLRENAWVAVGGTGAFLFLIGLTEINDIAAAIVGRRFGRRRLAPVLSPNKTYAGLAGGMVVTVALAMLVGPMMMPLGVGTSALAGLVVAVAGTLGDLNMSAIKRSAGVKDSGSILPGQGGILDRIDSLTFSAPSFYLLLYLLTP